MYGTIEREKYVISENRQKKLYEHDTAIKNDKVHHQSLTRAVLGFRGFGFRGVCETCLSFGMVVLDMSWLVFMYAVKKKKKDLSRTMEVDQRSGLC